jgi:hypothetical protein
MWIAAAREAIANLWSGYKTTNTTNTTTVGAMPLDEDNKWSEDDNVVELNSSNLVHHEQTQIK